MAGITLYVTGDKAIQQIFNRLESADANDLLNVIGESILDDVFDRFDKGQAPDGTKWEASKAAQGRDHKDDSNRKGKTLVDSAILRDSFSAQPVGGSSVAVGTNQPYAAIHNFGGKNGRGRKNTVPKRQILGISGTQLGIVNRAATDFMSVLLPGGK
ncbi:MAG: phage virion morphogenesis protein [Pseudomonas sp.]|nr:phage virion morphogenesis protein [Pseudomonas sp.]